MAIFFWGVLNHALVTFPPPKFCQRGQSPRNLQVKQLQKLQVEAAQAFTWGLSMRPFGAKLPFPTVDVIPTFGFREMIISPIRAQHRADSKIWLCFR